MHNSLKGFFSCKTTLKTDRQTAKEIVMTVTKRGKYERKERNSYTKSIIINIE